MITLVTGANGFVGWALCNRLCKDGFFLRRATRAITTLPNETTAIEIASISSETDWSAGLKSVQQVVHLAARVHEMNEISSNALTDFRRVNVEGTANLARQAAAAGVRRFVFLSSIKVNGEFTEMGQPFTADSLPTPQDPYGVSKHEAEQLLNEIATETGMEVVIIRPPLVYGPGVKANFESMMRWLSRGIPLPLAAIKNNRRSLVALDNLVDLIVTCLNHPAAANQTFLVSDGEDLSTADLMKRICEAWGRRANLYYVPPELLKLGAAVFRKHAIYQRLCGSLQVDISKTSHLLGWAPPVSVDEGLRRAAKGIF